MSSPITRRVQNALYMKSALKQTEEENNPNVTTQDLGTVGNTDSGTIQQGTRTTTTSESYVPGQDLVRLSYDDAWDQNLEDIQNKYPNKEAYIADREGQKALDPKGFEADLVKKTGVSGGPGTVSTPGTTVINEDIVDNYEDIPSSYQRMSRYDAGRGGRGRRNQMRQEFKDKKLANRLEKRANKKGIDLQIPNQIRSGNYEIAGNFNQGVPGTFHEKTFTNINDDSYNVPNLNTGNNNNNNDNNNNNNNSGSGVGINQSNYNLGDASKNFLDKTNEMISSINVPDLVNKSVDAGGKLLDSAGINTGDKRKDKLVGRMIDSYNEGNTKRGDRLRNKLKRKNLTNTQVEKMKEAENSPNKMKKERAINPQNKSDYSPFKMGGYGHKRDSAMKMDDLSGDGKVTKKDVLIGRGVLDKDGSPLKQSKIQRGIEGAKALFSTARKKFGRAISGDKTPGRKKGSTNTKTVVKDPAKVDTKTTTTKKTPTTTKKKPTTKKTASTTNTKTPNNTKTPTSGKPSRGKRAMNIGKRVVGYGGLGYVASNMMKPSMPENVNVTPTITIPGGGGTPGPTNLPSKTQNTTAPSNVERRQSRKITFNNVENPQYSSSPKRGPQAGPGDKVSTSNNRQAQRIQNRDQRASNRQRRRTDNLAARQQRRSMRRANPTIIGGAMRNTFGGKTYDTQINNMRKSSPNKMGKEHKASGFKMKGYGHNKKS